MSTDTQVDTNIFLNPQSTMVITNPNVKEMFDKDIKKSGQQKRRERRLNQRKNGTK